MANNYLILRTLQSSYGDITLGRVLSHEDLDNNFLYLKGLSIYTASTNGNNLILSQKNGGVISTDLSQLINSGSTSGGTNGNGTINFISKWSGVTSLTDSQIFDDGTNVGLATSSPAFRLDVNGVINTNNGVRISTNGANTGIYGGANQLNFLVGNSSVGRFSLVGSISGLNYYTFDGPFTNTIGTSGSQSSIRVSSNVTSVTANSMNYTQISIVPTYNQSTFGQGTLRGLHYNPNISSLNTSQHIAWENTSGDIIFGNLASSSNSLTQVNSGGTISRVNNVYIPTLTDGYISLNRTFSIDLADGDYEIEAAGTYELFNSTVNSNELIIPDGSQSEFLGSKIILACIDPSANITLGGADVYVQGENTTYTEIPNGTMIIIYNINGTWRKI